jgi:polygalacturonase
VSTSKRVVFPAKGTGTTVFVVGAIDLSCNDTVIEVQRDVVVRSTHTTVGWPLGPDCPEPSQGLTSRQAAPFIMLRGVRNVTLTGGGVLDANGPMWWAEHCGNWWCPKWLPNATAAHPYAWRPFMLRIMESAEVNVAGLTFKDCGFWCIVPTHSHAVTVSNCTVDTGGTGPNTDGVEPMWSTSVHVRSPPAHTHTHTHFSLPLSPSLSVSGACPPIWHYTLTDNLVLWLTVVAHPACARPARGNAPDSGHGHPQR